MEEIKGSSNNAVSTGSKNNPVVKPLTNDEEKSSMNWSAKTITALLLVIVVGVATGYGVYAQKTAGTVRLAGKDVEIVKTANEEGVKDASTFRDTAKGKVSENDGKITDEGTHILEQKPGDASQNVYLTSSVVDMSKYVGKQVQVWGETFQGRKAGWLMDVGRVKVL